MVGAGIPKDGWLVVVVAGEVVIVVDAVVAVVDVVAAVVVVVVLVVVLICSYYSYCCSCSSSSSSSFSSCSCFCSCSCWCNRSRGRPNKCCKYTSAYVWTLLQLYILNYFWITYIYIYTCIYQWYQLSCFMNQPGMKFLSASGSLHRDKNLNSQAIS